MPIIPEYLYQIRHQHDNMTTTMAIQVFKKKFKKDIKALRLALLHFWLLPNKGKSNLSSEHNPDDARNKRRRHDGASREHDNNNHIVTRGEVDHL